MKKIFSFIFIAATAATTISSCRKADPVIRKSQNEMSDIYATTPDKGRERLFDARYSAAKDTIYFDIPWFSPQDSDNEVDLSQIILRATIPSDAIISPALGSPMDLRNPVPLSITAGDGSVANYVVVGRKVGNTTVSAAAIEFNNNGTNEMVEAVIQENEILFYILPGTDVSNATFTYAINRHSTANIAYGSSIDLSSDVPFIVTGVDGVAKTYTLKAKEPIKLTYGAGINRSLWNKSASELGFTDNMEVCLAVSGDHLILTRRTNPSKYSVFNRFTGTYLQDMKYPFSGLSFQVVNDNEGHLLAASWAPKNASFIVYRYNDALDAAPVKLIEWVNNNPAGITGDGGVGRRVNVYGDINGDAVITAPAGQSDVIMRWRIVGGTLVSNTPEVVVYKSLAGGAATKMGYYAEAQPVSAAANGDYFINYQFEVAYVNGATNERSAALTLGWPVVFNMPTAYASFNGAKYLAIVKYIDTYSLNKVQTSLYDVTSPSNLGMAPSNPAYPDFNIFNSGVQTGTTNGNGTADIAVGYSNNGERMQVYTLLTNGGVAAHEFTNYAK
ncbi:DUF5018 domain-containing protein [Flavihumibacter solisilvae]|uniref:DUF5018 domain-containing protein n=1 Tax=Flavihumibacter solisilvae TaxID=1349421 RepID=A0A0C1LFF3_9BACT|nr:DUF5018 domain-containing protein [Flavihumibacter solisilvae]KIC94063.1 hypothetical protein OI18_13740 [Flavihumibacter solisilvae]